MPRANRVRLENGVWHITHRCHQREFLLKFAKDRRNWRHWLLEAKKRFGLCVLDYIVTSNHIHLLVRDRGRGEVACSMQLIAGRTAQAYNLRKGRKGAFWEDRYHATAVDAGEYLARCLVYVDLNMVRAGVVAHPAQWGESGYREIQQPAARYRIVDLCTLSELLGFSSWAQLQREHGGWVAEALRVKPGRERVWSDSLAVGSRSFVEGVQTALGGSARYRTVEEHDAVCALREPVSAYGAYFPRKMSILKGENAVRLE